MPVLKAAFAVEMMEARTLLSTVVYTVQTNSDTLPPIVAPSGTNAYSANTLRAAVDSASDQPFPVVIQFNPAAFTGGAANTITLTSGLTLAPATSVAPHSYKLVGPTGNPITVSGAGVYTDFTVTSGISAEFDNLTIAHGSGTNGGGIDSAGQLTLTGDTFASNVATSDGGGVYSANGLVTVTSCSFVSNSASQGGGVYIQDAYPSATPTFSGDTFTGDTSTTSGGAIENNLTASGLSAALSISGSQFNSDSSQGQGGAVYNLDSIADQLTTSITSSTFTGDSAAADGGAVYSASGKSLTINTDTFTNNDETVDFGGAIYDGDYALSLISSTLSGNQAFDDGGGVDFQSAGGTGSASLTLTNDTLTNNKSLDDNAGAIDIANSDTVAAISGSTFTGNSALQYGGAIYSAADDGSLTLTNDTISKNSSLNQGGGVYSGDGALTVAGSTFASDASTNQAGGAIYQDGAATLSITGSSFTGDSSYDEGGALHLDDDSAAITITNSKFYKDHTTDVEDGGGIYSDSTSLSVTGCTFSSDDSSEQGGGIYNDAGTLTVGSSTFSNNTASGGGGAIADDSADITTITGSTFTSNSVTGSTADGGAINSNAGTLDLTGDTFTSNSANEFGGGVYFDGGALQAQQLTFSGNTALDDGGAVYTFDISTSDVFDSTFDGNSASTNTGNGGAIDEQGTTVNYANDTFNGNSAGADGGAVYVDSGGTATITDSTIADNSAGYASGGGIYSDNGDVILDGTIVAGNFVTGTPATLTDLAGSNGFDTASTDNIIGDGLNAVGFSYGNVGGNFVGTDFVPINPLLGALANNGGPTQTMMPASTSLAIGNSTNFVVDDQYGNDVTAVDQRGVSRPQSQGYDIGAYQLIPYVAPDYFVFVAVPSSATEGTAFYPQVEVFTPSGSLDSGFSDSVTLSSSDGKAQLTPTALDFIDGIATFSATFNTTGQQTLQVTDSSTDNTVSPVTSSPVTVNAPPGSITGNSLPAAASYNLTALGTSDWAHWGLGGNGSAFDHSATGGSQISNVTRVGSGGFGGYYNPSRSVSFTNGSPVASSSGDDGYIWANNGIGAGYSFTVPASATSQTLYIYLGGYSSGGTLTAHLSDGSAADYSASLSGSGTYTDLIAITYKAASGGQTLKLTYTKSTTINGAGGSVDLIAAWLAGPAVKTAPAITANPSSQTVTTGATVTFAAAASGNPAPTVQWMVETPGSSSFSPISGATSTTLNLGATTVSENGNKYEAVFSNGVGAPVTTTAATLTVNPVATSGSLAGTSSVASTTDYNLTALGTSDWAHWGTYSNPATFDHKATGGSQISNATKVGNGNFGAYSAPGRTVSWTDGAPLAADTGDQSYLWANNAIGAGYSFTVPASATKRTLYIYLGGYSSGSTLTAHLSDGSAADYSVNLSGSGTYTNVIAITYNAASAGQTLTLTYLKSSNINGTGGSADLIAAWLA